MGPGGRCVPILAQTSKLNSIPLSDTCYFDGGWFCKTLLTVKQHPVSVKRSGDSSIGTLDLIRLIFDYPINPMGSSPWK